MKTWSSLLRKEYLLNRTLVRGGLLLVVLSFLLASYLKFRYQSHNPGLVLMQPLAGLWIWYLPVFLFTSLSKEWKYTSHLWLHLPQSGWQLLAAKFLAGLPAMLGTMILYGLLTAWIAWEDLMPLLSAYSIPFSIVLQWAAILLVIILAMSFYLGLWAVMASVAMASFKHLFRRGRWLVGLGVLLLPTWGMSALGRTSFYQGLTQWGAFQVSLPLPPELISLSKAFTYSFYAGEVLFYLLICAGLFFLAGWLLDYKVEV